MPTPVYRRTSCDKTSRSFRLDFRRRVGSRLCFGAAGENPSHRLTTNAAWGIAGMTGIVTVMGWLLGWPVMMGFMLWGVVVVLLASTHLIERCSRVRSKDIVIDMAEGTLTIPDTLPDIRGAYRLEELNLLVRSDNPHATTAVTRDYHVVVEGELAHNSDTVTTFEVKLIGPGFQPEMNDEADLLLQIGTWRNG
ncbi:hypothetical protein IT570_05690 [Candidatus Sumerlaeota bacterium]|nr:hypothetical protein [Candidatus Sumerlaeota bacterium]